MNTQSKNDFQRASDDLKNGRISHGTEFGSAEVRAIRKSMGYTQEDFAMFMSVSVDTVRSWENGRRRPGDELRSQMSGALATITKTKPFCASELAALRSRLKLSQEEFGTRYGFDLTTIRKWEGGTANPDAIASQLLRMISADPVAAFKLAKKARTLEPL